MRYIVIRYDNGWSADLYEKLSEDEEYECEAVSSDSNWPVPLDGYSEEDEEAVEAALLAQWPGADIDFRP